MPLTVPVYRAAAPPCTGVHRWAVGQPQSSRPGCARHVGGQAGVLAGSVCKTLGQKWRRKTPYDFYKNAFTFPLPFVAGMQLCPAVFPSPRASRCVARGGLCPVPVARPLGVTSLVFQFSAFCSLLPESSHGLWAGVVRIKQISGSLGTGDDGSAWEETAAPSCFHPQGCLGKVHPVACRGILCTVGASR